MATRNILSSTLDDMLPLLRSIQAEINDRLGAIETLERRMQAFLPTRHVHEVEVARIDAELSTHRRELRLISKELSRLGVAFDAEHPHPIVTPARAQAVPELGETGFHPWMADTRS